MINRFDRWSAAVARALLVLQPVLFYWSVLIVPTRHIPYDLEAYHYPTLAFIAACVRRHQWPLWDPNMYAGMPLHSDPQSQMFYPPAWIAMALGNLSAGLHLFLWVEWMVAAHMILAGLFAFQLLRRMNVSAPAALLGATVYQLGGYFASQACHLGAICAGAWLPLIVLGIHERRHLLTAGGMALTILAGYAPATIVVGGAAMIYCVVFFPWRQWAAVAAAFGAAALACSVQLIPMIRLTSLSIASLRSEWLTAWGAPLESLASLVWPNRYGIFDLSTYRLHFNFTLLYVYCGLIPLALLFAGALRLRARVFLLMAVFSAVLMLGEHTPVYPLIFGHLPQLIRGASYAWFWMMAFCFFAGIAAAIALEEFRSRIPTAVIWTLAIVTSGDLILAGRDRPMNSSPGSYLLSNSEYRYAGSAENLKKLRDLVNVATPPLRIDYADLWPPGVIMGGMLGLPTTDGNVPFMLRGIYQVRSQFCATTPGARDLAIAGAESPIFRRNLPVNRFDSQWPARLNTGFIASTDPLPVPSESIAGLNVYRVPNPLSRFYLSPPGAGSVAVLRYEPTEIELEVDSNAAAFLSTSEAYYPGWRATVGGRTAAVRLTDIAFRGVDVPAGRNKVIFSYRPTDLYVGATVSGVSILAGLALLSRLRSIRRGAATISAGVLTLL